MDSVFGVEMFKTQGSSNKRKQISIGNVEGNVPKKRRKGKSSKRSTVPLGEIARLEEKRYKLILL